MNCSARAGLDAVALAEHLGLSVYDASYIWLARKLQSELITFDQQLAETASP